MYSQSLVTGSGVTLGEALSTGGATTLIGLLIVFAVLIILMIVLMLFKVIFYKEPKKAQIVQETAPKAAQIIENTHDEEDEDELIAVLTAAVAASLNTSTYKLNIKSIRRIDNNTPAWNRAGVTETINNRF